jgi:uncharacterized protein GlcG (DUF336 family)
MTLSAVSSPPADWAIRASSTRDGQTSEYSLPSIIAISGALPIKVGDGVIGAAAVSGSPGGNDEACAIAGLDKIKDRLN